MDRRLDLLGTAEPGLESAAELARVTDDAIIALARSAAERAPGRWAVVAVGGYGAGRLLPASDIDLLVLVEGATDRYRSFVEAILYPLWDAGLVVGHQVRTRREHLTAVRSDLHTLTASLTARPLAGDRSLAERAISGVVRECRRSRRTILGVIATRERPGSPYLLEPDLKEGAGGQRDLDELVWTARILSVDGSADLDVLVNSGHLDRRERERLTAALEGITATRWDLQTARPRSRSRLTLDTVGDVRVPAEFIQSAVADVHHILLRVRRSIAGTPEPAPSPLLPDSLMHLLLQGEASLDTLEELAWQGRLDRFVPGMKALMTVRRPALTHRFTVGAHSLRAATFVAGLSSLDDGALRRSMGAIGDRAIITVAALAHDVGKAEGDQGHAERGAPIARQAALNLGLTDNAADDVGELVRHHLMLAEASIGEDIDSEDIVLALASRLRDRRLVPALHALAAADAIATGPGAWTEWHATLAGQLAGRLDSALSPNVDGAGIVERAERARALALARIDDEHSPLARFVEHASLRYLSDRNTARVIDDARLVAALGEPPDGRRANVAVRAGPHEGSWEVAVAVADRHERLALVAGILSLVGLDILSAEAHTTTQQTVLDVFIVRSATGAEVDQTTWARFERQLSAVLNDRLDLRTRLAARAREYDIGERRMSPHVEFDHARDFATVLRVRAADRVGLLHDIAREVSRAGLDVRSARVVTRDGVADDVFLLVDGTGRPPRDPGVLGHLSMRIRSVA